MDKDTLKEIADQKEKEWRQIQEQRYTKNQSQILLLKIKSLIFFINKQRIHVLEKSLNQKCKELNEEKEKLNHLKEDFKYNLKLLEERDSDLEKYEQSLSSSFFLLNLSYLKNKN